MSSPRYDWWSYVKGMIRRYPQLRAEYNALHQATVSSNISGMPRSGGGGRTTEGVATRMLPNIKQRELEAVERAIRYTENLSAGPDRLKIIRLVFWQRSHTLAGAAMQIPCSERQARRYHTEFIYCVAKEFGLLD